MTMALTDRFAEALRSPGQRTFAYILGFGLGSVVLSAALSWAAVSATEWVLPSKSTGAPRDATSASPSGRGLAPLASVTKPSLSPRTLSKTPGSKAGPGRGNDSPSSSGE